jgi:hypothetical protein
VVAGTEPHGQAAVLHHRSPNFTAKLLHDLVDTSSYKAIGAITASSILPARSIALQGA